MIKSRTNAIRSNAGVKAPLFALALAVLLCAITISAGEALAQARRTTRLQKRIEKIGKEQQRHGTSKLAPSNSSSGNSTPETTAPLDEQTGTATAKNGAQAERHSLDGVKEKGLVTIFRREERDLIIPGFGNPASLLIVFRQLDLTDQQKQGIKAIKNRVGNRLGQLQREHRELDLQLTDAIYGENFDPKRAEELAAQVAERQGEIIKLRASIEVQLRQVMTPDQFYVFHWLIGQMILPQRRIPPALLRQMMQRRTGAPNRPNQQDFQQ